MPAEENVQPSHLKGRIVFTSMYNDINSGQNGNAEKCKENATHVASLARDIEPGRWSFLGPGDEKLWYGSLTHKPEGKGNSTAKIMMQEFADGGHPVCRCPRPLSKGVLTGKEVADFPDTGTADLSTAEMLVRSIIAVNQLNLDGG